MYIIYVYLAIVIKYYNPLLVDTFDVHDESHYKNIHLKYFSAKTAIIIAGNQRSLTVRCGSLVHVEYIRGTLYYCSVLGYE